MPFCGLFFSPCYETYPTVVPTPPPYYFWKLPCHFYSTIAARLGGLRCSNPTFFFPSILTRSRLPPPSSPALPPRLPPAPSVARPPCLAYPTGSCGDGGVPAASQATRDGAIERRPGQPHTVVRPSGGHGDQAGHARSTAADQGPATRHVALVADHGSPRPPTPLAAASAPALRTTAVRPTAPAPARLGSVWLGGGPSDPLPYARRW